MNTFIKTFLFLNSLLFFACNAQQKTVETPKLKALIIDGQSNHGIWPKTTAMMKDYLEETGMFTVNIERTKYLWLGPHSQMDSLELAANHEKYKLNDKEYESLAKPKADPNFTPNFADYDVIVNNFGWQTADWPESTKKAFEEYMANGGGMVTIHAADNAFGQWDAYNEMIGLGAWGDRTIENGPYVYYSKDEEKLTRDTTNGSCGSHGAQHEALLTVRTPEHPIVKGMPSQWLHTADEVYERLRGPAENMTILATAYSGVNKEAKKSGRTDRHEPMLMVINYKKGRIFHITLGHSDVSMECTGLKTAFERGTEWAATGDVTQKLPTDFPGTKEVSKIDWE
ncbi:MAG: type 1 glutamine amidotransferase [Spirosomataceae bacterium]|jgi:type 1 glutamine amidotransferase